MRIALVGAGAFGIRHLAGLRDIGGVEVASIVDSNVETARAVADRYGARHADERLDQALARPDVDAVILCTPTQMHAAQSIAAMKAGKHVQVEIPLCDRLEEGRAVVEMQKKTGLVAMVGHTRRFNPSHQYVHKKIRRASSTSSRWTCRPTSSAART